MFNIGDYVVYKKEVCRILDYREKLIGEKDNNYFNLAEKYLYSEFAIALGMDYDDVKSYIFDRIDNKSNK